MNSAPQPDTESETPANALPVRTPWHRILARLLELLLTPLGVTVQTELPVISDPPKLDILLVRRSGKHWTEKQLRLLCDGLRNVSAAILLIEFKFSESFNVEALRQALGYDYFFRTGQTLAQSEVASFIMVARTPRASVLQELGYEASELPGVYRTRHPVLERVQIIVLNQLRSETHNFFVQQFASQRQVRNAAFTGLNDMDQREMNDAVLELMVGLQSKFEWKEETMGKVKEQEIITPDSLIELGREIRKAVITHMKPEERKAIIAHMNPEERKAIIAHMNPEERKAIIAHMNPEERKAIIAAAPLEERLIGLTPAEMTQLMERIAASLQQSN